MQFLRVHVVAAWSLLLFCQTLCAQSQLDYDFVEDYGGGRGQTFVTKQAGPIDGVRLVIQGSGNSNDVTVRLHELNESGIPIADIAAEGILSASEISTTSEQWYFIQFDSSFSVAQDDSLAFLVYQFGSGPTGFVSYGATHTNPYPLGNMIGQSSPGGSIVEFPKTDFAFEIVYVPAPAAVPMLFLTLLTGPRRKRLCAP